MPENNQDALLERCKDILRGAHADLDEIVLLVRQLKNRQEFGYARRLLARAREDPALHPGAEIKLWLGQQHALCTYKDPHLTVDSRFDRALEILDDADDLVETHSQETLGLAGAIHKYRWDVMGQLSDLEQAAVYYLRGYRLGPETDCGYTGINAAYVLDVLAAQLESFARKAGGTSPVAAQRRAEAHDIREHLRTVLPELPKQPGKADLANDWWFLVTIAEAYFGLGEFDKAAVWLQDAKSKVPGVEGWQFEGTARQLAAIARMLDGSPPPADGVEASAAWKTLEAFLGNSAAVRSAYIGRVGLALSGGGFRASFFHIGVLAKLAELDVLRHVEVLSCVSGGSIVGAQYFLELQRVLENKRDQDITRDDYIAIVRRVAEFFTAGVQRNIRTRVAANLLINLKMLLFPNYSRSEHIAELYERELFGKVDDNKAGAPRFLDQLKVRPKDEVDDFAPKNHNWRRNAKVPMPVFNATTLNNGHNWQFTATYMGEPPGAVDSEVDGNYRLRRMYYEEAPPDYKRVRLAYAVAASAGVPGLFDPITLQSLFPDIIVRLVDGGVHDNQGVSALFEQGCSVLLVSDASGQMGTLDAPGNSSLSVLLRSNSIMGACIRGAEFHDMEGRRKSGLLRGLMYVHLKKDLESDPKNWIGCQDTYESSTEGGPAFRRGVLTSYGIRKDVQKLIADIRTDLDSFHEVEAFALMTSGYRMTETEFAQTLTTFPKTPPVTPAWRFLDIEEPMKRCDGIEKAHESLKKLLSVSNRNALKVWFLVPWLRWTGAVLLAALAIAFVIFALSGPSIPLFTLRAVAITLLAAAAAQIFGKKTVAVFRYRATIERYAAGILLCAVGWLLAGLHLLIFDRFYLKLGSADRLLALMQGSRPQPNQPLAGRRQASGHD